MADERMRITRFDMWFFRVAWVGMLLLVFAIIIYVSAIAISIATAGHEGAGRQAGVLLAIQAVLMVLLVWGMMRTPWMWRTLNACVAADAPHVAARGRQRMIDWLRRTWQETDPAKNTVPSVGELPADDWLRANGLDDNTIERLKTNPRAFPNALRRVGIGCDVGVRGEGLSARTVGAVHYLWSRLA